MRLSIVVPIHGTEYVGTCVTSTRRNTLTVPGDFVELILVNSATPDPSAMLFLKSLDPDVLIDLAVNRRFAGACNAGAGVAYGDLICFLNADAAVHPAWNVPIVEAFEADPKVGMIGPATKKPDETEWTDHGQELYDGRLIPAQVGPLTPEGLMPVFACSGGCMVVRRTTFLELGGFDEEYQNSCEDVDLCARMRAAGLGVYTHRDSGLDHVYGAYRGTNPATNFIASRARFNELYEGSYHVQEAHEDCAMGGGR